jgi:hypothetical protein
MMTEVSSKGKPRKSSKIGKHFEEAVAQSRAVSQEKVAHLKQQTRGESFSSISGRWSNALEGSKEYESMKIRAVKRNSINVAEGFVSSRVIQLEQCVMQAQASSEQIANMLHRLLNVPPSEKQVRISISPQDHDESTNTTDAAEANVVPTLQFTCDNTSSYHFDSWSTTYQHLNALLQSNCDHPVALPCGVFMSSDDAQLQDSTRPEVIAVAMRDSDTHEPYIALTITSPAHAQNEASVCLGPTKVAFFLPSHSEGEELVQVQGQEREQDDEEELAPVWEAIFDLQAAAPNSQAVGVDDAEELHTEEGNANCESTDKTSTDDTVIAKDDSVELHVDQKNVSTGNGCDDESLSLNARSAVLDVSFDESEASFGRGRGGYVSDSDSAVDEGEDIWTEAGHTPGKLSDQSTVYDTDASSVSSSMPNTPMKGASPAAAAAAAAIFSLENGLPEIRNNVKRTVSVNEIEKQYFAKIAMEKKLNTAAAATNNIITMDSEPMTLSHDQDDSSNSNKALRDVQYSSVVTHINAFDIIVASSSRNMLIIKNRVDACTTVISTDQPDDNNSSVNSLQETTIDAASNVAISNNTLVQWTRAVAMSGWLTKWPMQNQKVCPLHGTVLYCTFISVLSLYVLISC